MPKSLIIEWLVMQLDVENVSCNIYNPRLGFDLSLNVVSAFMFCPFTNMF